MDNPDVRTSEISEAGQLQEQLDSLHHLFLSVLVLMVVLSGTLSIFLLRQWKMASKDFASFRPAAMQIIADYTKERAPRMDSFIEKIKEYGRTHPDFTPILVRYSLVSNTTPGLGSAPSPMPRK